MLQFFRIVGVPLVLLLVLLTPVFAQDSSENQIQRILASTAGPTEPGVVVLVRKDCKTQVQAARGVRELRSRSILDASTDFRLASCTKEFTAMAIMLLVHDGKLRYDEHLTDIFPEFPGYGRTIAI